MGGGVLKEVHFFIWHAIEEKYCLDLYHLRAGTISVFDMILCVASVLFLVYLLSGLKQAIHRLRLIRSPFLLLFYSLVWGIAILNFVHTVVPQVFRVFGWDVAVDVSYVLFQVVTFGGEMAVVIFMLQGSYGHPYLAMLRSMAITAVVVLIYVVAEAMLLWQGGVQVSQVDDHWALVSWGVVSTTQMLLYGTILLVSFTPLRKYLPSRVEFYVYCGFLFTLYFASFIGEVLAIGSIGIGYCFLDLAVILYYSLFGPILYWALVKDALTKPIHF